MLAFACSRCAASSLADPALWRCPGCGGTLQIPPSPFVAPPRTAVRESLWRYARNLPTGGEPVTLGEGGTPLLPGRLAGRDVLYKCEQQNPTGSFKDRGASVLVTWLKEFGAERLVEDSSGNAGIALAAYASRAGIRAQIHLAGEASPAKARLIEAYGAEAVRVPGDRGRAAESARAASGGGVYASHVYQPHFLQGCKTLAFEIWEATVRRPPRAVALPVGNGSLALGLFLGFRELQMAGRLDRPPRLLGYQAEGCAPLGRAFREGLDHPAPVGPSRTRAEGIAVADPPRGAEILRAFRECSGWIGTVSEEGIARARGALARQGILLEWTSAAAVAGIEEDLGRRQIEEPIVIVLTAGGLKNLGPAPLSRPA